MTATRRIFRSSTTSNAEVRELLELLFVSELLLPSKCLWLVSPWLTDLEILDNRSGAFASIDPQWGSRRIRLAEILGKMLELGSHIVIATRTGQHNDSFVRRLDDLARSSGSVRRLTIHRRDTLHLKGLLGNEFYLSGSMNFTFNGVEILEEGLTFETSRDATESARIPFLDSYGGVV